MARRSVVVARWGKASLILAAACAVAASLASSAHAQESEGEAVELADELISSLLEEGATQDPAEVEDETNFVPDVDRAVKKPKAVESTELPATSTATPSDVKTIPLCELPPLLDGFVNTTCLDTATWYTFEKSSQQCVRFIYGGCGKSANLFPTEEECRKACRRKRADDNADCTLVCPTTFKPVCGSNNVTYANECDLKAISCREKLNITAAYVGQCAAAAKPGGNEAFDEPTVAPSSTSSVTAAATQPSTSASAASTIRTSSGPTTDPTTTTTTASAAPSRSPICSLSPIAPGFDRTCFAALPRFTFNPRVGRCVFYLYGGCGGSENLFRNESECKRVCPDVAVDDDDDDDDAAPSEVEEVTTKRTCPNVCPANENPVCGTDEVTYPNACVLEVTACSRNVDIRIAYLGPCREPPVGFVCPECTALVQPVCANNGETYGNICELERHACARGLTNLTLDHDGPCGAAPNGSGSSSSVDAREKDPACLQDVYTGPCYVAAFRKWGYNKESGRCEWFFYGGCMGNDNRFDTPYDCQTACGGTEPLTDFTCDQRKCPWKVWAHYRVKGCRPVYDYGKCCPTRFECLDKPTRESGEPQCSYKGGLYNVGDEIPAVNENEPCFQKCVCKLHPEYTNIAEVHCEQTQCTLFHGALDIFEKSCRKIYQKGKCCPTSIKCDDFQQYGGNINGFFCEYDGRKYVEGERIDVPDQGKQCYCNQAWVNEGGPVSSACQPVSCGWESQHQAHFQRGCAPVWRRGLMCPVDWICPEHRLPFGSPSRPAGPPEPANAQRRDAPTDPFFDDDEDMEAMFSSDPFFDEPIPFLTVPGSRAAARKSAPSQYGCKLGSEKFNIGESFGVDREHSRYVKCTCLTPPELTCEEAIKPYSPVAPAGPTYYPPQGREQLHSSHHGVHHHFQHGGGRPSFYHQQIPGKFYRSASGEEPFRWRPSGLVPMAEKGKSVKPSSFSSTTFPSGWKIMMKYK